MSTRSKAAAAALLERPLTARSVIASLLLGRHPPSAPASLLVRWCALFDITETAARVALTRMVQAGELTAADGAYELVGRIRNRQVEQDFALAPALTDWDGGWTLAIAPRGSRSAAERLDLRNTMSHLRMAPLRDGVWIRPDNVPDLAAADERCTWVRHGAVDRSEITELVALFQVDVYEQRTLALLPALRSTTSRLPAADALADGFGIGAAVAQHLRRDPLLPDALLPRPWTAGRLRDAYAAYRRAFGAAVAAWAAAT